MTSKSPQYWAGKLLGFYEAGDMVLNYLNTIDIEGMTTNELRRHLYGYVMGLRLKVK